MSKRINNYNTVSTSPSIQISNTNTIGNLFTTGGNVGIGVVTPNAPLQFANSFTNRRIVLYDNNNNNNQYYGFGVNNDILRYQVDLIGSSHVFYAGVNSSTSNELMRITGTGNLIVAGTFNSVSVSSGNIFSTNLTTGTISATSLTTSNAVFTNVSSGTINASTGITSATLLVTGMITASSVQATSSTVSNVVTTNISTGTLRGTDLFLSGTLTTVNITTQNLLVTSSSSTLGSLLVSNGNLNIYSGALNATGNSNTLGNIFTTGGNVGIGTITPGTILDIVSSTPIITIRESGNASGKIYFGNSSHGVGRNASIGTLINGNDVTLWTNGVGASIGFATQLTERMRITDSGSVGIGTSAPQTNFHVAGGGFQLGASNTAGVHMQAIDGALRVWRGTWGSGIVQFCSDSRGNFGIGTHTPSDILQVSTVMLMASSGNLTVTGDVLAFGTISDQRLKENVTDISTGLETICALRPVTFNWKQDIFNKNRAGSRDSGFIAQEVEQVLDHAVSEYTEIESGEKYKNMRHERIIPYLVKAIQELTQQVNELLKK
jgi:hypothetical protein